MIAVALDGETLDAVCWRVLGTTDPIEQVLELNPDLLSSPTLSGGTQVQLPDEVSNTAQTTNKRKKLWE